MNILRNTLKVTAALTVISFSSLGLGLSLQEQYSDSFPVKVSNGAETAQCFVTCGLSQREQAYIAYNSGAACEATADYNCALKFYSEAYRIWPTHPQIREKIRSYRTQQSD